MGGAGERDFKAMNFIDLCAGIGGFSLGLEMGGMTCAGQVETGCRWAETVKEILRG